MGQFNVGGNPEHLRSREEGNESDCIAYASSIAVFGPPDLYPEGGVGDDALQAPVTFYGAYKQACEPDASRSSDPTQVDFEVELA